MSAKKLFSIPAADADSLDTDSDTDADRRASPKADLRRYHALLELVDTERGYLNDLTVLVDVYLSSLATLSAPQRTRSSPSVVTPSDASAHADARHSTRPRPQSQSFSAYTYRPGVSSIPADSEGPSTQSAVPALSTAPVASRTFASLHHHLHPPLRPLFTNEETWTLARNASVLLDLHARFARSLQSCLARADLGFYDRDHTWHPQTNTLDAAISAVCERFIEQAPDFDVYEIFCAGHTDALDLVRRAQDTHPVVWEAWERACATRVGLGDEEQISSASADITRDLDGTQTAKSQLDRRLRRSSASAALPAQTAFAGLGITPTPHTVSIDANCNLSADEAESYNDSRSIRSSRSHSYCAQPTRPRTHAKLTFTDYLIKPVQRVCRYPLLLDQLRDRSLSHPVPPPPTNNLSVAEALVSRATQAMRSAALAVDQARLRQNIATRSHIVATRLTAHARCPLPRAFLSTLGACLLSGTLDVIYSAGTDDGTHQQTSRKRSGKESQNDSRSDVDGTTADVPPPPRQARSRRHMKAKYLGVFLYVGGYIVLAKAAKAGVFEARHWFTLAGFELLDVADDDALLPCSFRLVRAGHLFELGATCAREKAVWIAALCEARRVPPAWQHEPISSLSFQDGPPPAYEDGPGPPLLSESATEMSIPMLRLNSQPSSVTLKGDLTLRHVTAASHTIGASSNRVLRRSSTASIRSLFLSAGITGDAPVVRRTTASRRAQIDRLLLDVFSEPCLAARAHAQREASREEDNELARSVSAISSVAGRGTVSESESSNVGTLITRAKSLASRRRNRRSLRVKPTLSTQAEDIDSPRARVSLQTMFSPPHSPRAPSHSPESEPTASLCSSVTTSQGNSETEAVSPLSDEYPSPTMLVFGTDKIALSEDAVPPRYTPKRTSSFADNVRGLFVPRSMSFASSVTDVPTLATPAPRMVSRLWRSTSLQHRARSAPEVFADAPHRDASGATSAARPSPQRAYSESEHFTQSPTLPTLSNVVGTFSSASGRTSLDARPLLFGQREPRLPSLEKYHAAPSTSQSLRRIFKRHSFFNNLNPLTPMSKGQE